MLCIQKVQNKHLLHNFASNVKKHTIHNFYHGFMFLKLKQFLFVNVEDNTFGLNGKCLTSKTFYRRDIA